MPTARFLRHGSMLAVLAALATSLGGCASSQKTTPVLTEVPFTLSAWEFQGSPGHQMETEHYQIYTTLDDKVLLEAIPQVVETAYLFYRELVPTAHAPQERMPVYLFARRSEWADFTRRLAGPRARTLLQVRQGGYSERGVSVAEYVSNSVTFPLLTHEGFHQYLHHCVSRSVPAWLNEGLAVLCEGQRWSDAGLEEFDPWYNPARRNTLAEALLRGDLFPLDELLQINAGDVIGGSSRKVNAYYGQLWALMLFLRQGEDGKYAERFTRLLHALGSHDLQPFARAAHVGSTHPTYNFGRDLFCSFITTDLATFEREFTAFMRQKILSAH